MNCKKIKKQIYYSDLKESELDLNLKNHLDNCPDCHLAMEKKKLMQKVIGETMNYPLPLGFENSLHKKLIDLKYKVNPENSISSAWQRFWELSSDFFSSRTASAIAIILIFIAGVTIGYLLKKPSGNILSNAGLYVTAEIVPLNQPLKMDIEFESPVFYTNVTFKITLPSGVRFESTNSELTSMKELSWTGELKKGITAIPLIVTVINKGEWNIIVEAKAEGIEHKHELVLKSKG